ncbi:MAG: CapA family protein [bacterium]
MQKSTIKFLIFLFIPLCILQAGIIFFSIRKSATTVGKELSTQRGAQLLHPQGDIQPLTKTEPEEEQKQEIEQTKEEEVKIPAIKFLFFGDMMLDRNVGKQIKDKGLDYLFEKLAGQENNFFQGIDLIGCNLEGAVTNNGAHYAPQMAYDFAFNPDLINQLKKYNFNFFNTANNHLSDQGKKGVGETEKNLDEMNFNHSGSVDGTIDDCSSTIVDISGKKIGMAGFSAVYTKLDKEKLKTKIKDLADSTDLVIVNIHWGIEYANKFNKTQQDLAHTLIDSGADIIIGHHPHVTQGIEIYNNKPIFYSLGNFIFDQYFSKETQESFAVGINIEDEKTSIFIYPLKSKLSQTELMEGKEREEFLKNLVDWSEVDEEYAEEIKSGRIEL